MALEEFRSFLEVIIPASDTWKDYIFPTLQTFFATLAGAVSAYYIFLRQEAVLAGRKNIAAANQLTINVHAALQDIIRVKADYVGEITPFPIDRALLMPGQLSPVKKISFPIQDLGFLVPRGGGGISDDRRHLRILQLDSLCVNFNILCDFLDKRTQIDRLVRDRLAEIHMDTGLDPAGLDFREVISNSELILWLDLTERCLGFVDDLIIELGKVLRDLPEFANKMALEKGGSKDDKVFKIELPNLDRYFHRIPVVDREILAVIFNMPAEQFIHRYDNGYQ